MPSLATATATTATPTQAVARTTAVATTAAAPRLTKRPTASAPVPASSPTSPAVPVAGDTVTLGPGQAVSLAGGALTIRFVGVQGDSRCPETVACAWAGDATVALTVSASTGSTSVELHTSSRLGKTSAAAGYLISLLRLDPVRRTTDAIDPGTYRATVQVRRS